MDAILLNLLHKFVLVDVAKLSFSSSSSWADSAALQLAAFSIPPTHPQEGS